MLSTRGEKLFYFINYVVLTLFTLIVVFPFWYVICASITDYSVFSKMNGMVFYPKNINFDYYAYIIKGGNVFLRAYYNTIFNTVLGTTLALILTIGAGYALSEKKLPGHKFFNLYFIITMFFSGGLIPTYITVRNMDLLNTRFVLIIMLAFMTYYMIIMKSFFMQFPASLKEAAKIDGASEFGTLIKVVLPTSKTAIATIGLFYGVGYWNDFFTAMVYCSNTAFQPVQLLLRNIVNQGNVPPELMEVALEIAPPMIGVQMASVVLVALPLVVVYPFIQKYFEKGVMLGAVKE